MDRLACVNAIALPLQLLVRRHPDWIEAGPVAVVDRDEPNGTLEWVDREARRSRIRPGMRYAEALSIRGDLRAGTVEKEAVEAAVDDLVERLRDFSPFVEASEADPGLFWLDAAGLEGIFDSLEEWAEAIVDDLYDERRLYASIVVGFTRFGTYVLARSRRRAVVFSERAAERDAAREVPLTRVGLPSEVCEQLEKLGIDTVGAFLRLPPTGVRRRFGAKTYRLHQMARGDLQLPLQAELDEGPIERRVRLDDPVAVSSRLVFYVKRELNPLFARFAARQHEIEELEIELRRRSELLEQLRIRPATPTNEPERVLELVRLELEHRTLECGADDLEILVRTRRARSEQMHLFAEKPPRDFDDANRAIERLQAEFGRDAVVRAVPRAGHLPKARFEWKPFDRLEQLDPDPPPEAPSLARRFWRRPSVLPAEKAPGRQLSLPSGRGLLLGGPYLISGGWWVREVRRAYYFAENSRGELLWLYWDDRRDRWFLQGRVE